MTTATIAPEADGSASHQAIDLDDARLLRRIRSGDETGMADLYDAAAGQAFGLALRLLNDRSAAEDVVQDAFVALWRQAPRLDPDRGRVRALLMTIVHRRSVDVVRQRGRTAGPSIQIDDVPIADSSPNLVDLVTTDEARSAVHRAVATLPADQRRTVRLAYFQGVTHVEIARMMGVPPGTVKSRLRLALEKMRARLDVDLAC